MQQLAKNRQNTIAMGKRAKQQVKHISWKNTYQDLLGEALQKPKEIVVCLNFPIYPPRGGGQARVYNIYKQLAKHAKVTIITLAGEDNGFSDTLIAHHLREIRIPKTEKYLQQQSKLSQKLEASVDDIAFMLYHQSIPEYHHKIQQYTEQAQCVIASHPYAYPAIAENYQGKLWYEAHNVEYDMKQAVIKHSEHAEEYLQKVAEIEQQCCQQSAQILVCSEADQQRLTELYALKKAKFTLVPNGVDCQAVKQISPAIKQYTRQQLNIKNRKIALFIGSWHQPNLEALEAIKTMAEQTPEIDYFILGSVCLAPQFSIMPDNIYKLGVVSEAFKNKVLAVADVALNPITTGSGTNLKLIEYAAAGIPIITTPFGRRGLLYQPEIELIETELVNFAGDIKEIDFKGVKIQAMVTKARVLTETHYDWQQITKVLECKL